MSATQKIYKEFCENLLLSPGPDSPTFFEVWEAYTSVLNLVGVNLLKSKAGSHIDAAYEVRMYLERHSKVAAIAEDMPLLVPASVLRSVQVFGTYFNDNLIIREYLEFLNLTPAILDHFIVYSQNVLQRHSIPIVEALKVASRAAMIMKDCVTTEIEPYLMKGN